MWPGGEADGGVDDADMGKRLRVIAEEISGGWFNFLAEKTNVVHSSQGVLHEFFGSGVPAG